jgi:hypothetical protein
VTAPASTATFLIRLAAHITDGNLPAPLSITPSRIPAHYPHKVQVAAVDLPAWVVGLGGVTGEWTPAPSGGEHYRGMAPGFELVAVRDVAAGVGV